MRGKGTETLSQTQHVKNVDSTKICNSEKTISEGVNMPISDTPMRNANSGQSASATYVVPEDVQAALSPPNSNLSPTPSPRSALPLVPSSPAPSLCNGPQPSQPCSIEKSPAAAISTRTSSRITAKTVGREDDNPKYWSFDAGNYLMKSLAGFDPQKAVFWLKELDSVLGFPKGNVRISGFFYSKTLLT